MKLNLLLLTICFFLNSCHHTPKQAVETSLSVVTEPSDGNYIQEINQGTTESSDGYYIQKINQDTTGMNLNFNKLKKHLELQKKAILPDEYTFLDNYPEYPSSAYKYTIEDLELTLPFLEKELKKNSFKELSDEDFRKRIQEVFGIDINEEESENGIIPLLGQDDGETDIIFHKNAKYLPGSYYIEKNKKYIIYMFRLECLISFDDDEIQLKSTQYTTTNLVAMNKWLLENSKAAFRILALSADESKEREYDWCELDGLTIFSSLISDYYFDTDDQLNQRIFRRDAIPNLTFRQRHGKLYISEPLIKIIEENTSNDDYHILDDLGFRVFKIIKGERNTYFSENDKISIYHRFAILEKKLRDEYMVIEAAPAGWGASTTALVRTNFEEFYEKALESATGEAREAIEALTSN